MNWSAMYGFLSVVCFALGMAGSDVHDKAIIELGKERADAKYLGWLAVSFVLFVLFGALCFLNWGAK